MIAPRDFNPSLSESISAQFKLVGVQVFAGGLKNGIENLSNLLGSAFPSGEY